MKFLASFPHTSWDWYKYRDKKFKEGVIEGSDEVFNGESGGKIVLFESQNSISDTKILNVINAPQVYGLDYVVGEGLYFTTGKSCAKDNTPGIEKVVRINELGKKDLEINAPFFSHLHSIKRTKKGLLIVSTGLDSIIEIDLKGNILWDWWGTEQGYNLLKNGQKRFIDKNIDHRLKSYPTMFQTTHVSQALIDPYNDSYVLAILYHQNSIIRINKNTKEHTVLLNNLKRPHHLIEYNKGYLFTNTRDRSVVLCDQNFNIKDTFGQKLGHFKLSNWIQDTAPTPRGTYLISDEGNFRFIETDGYKKHDIFKYGKPDRMFEILIVPDSYNIMFKGDNI